MSTIFAQSTAPGKAGIAVFRISGEKSKYIFRKLTKHQEKIIKPRHAYLKNIYHPLDEQLIDQVIIIYFAGKNSFTGEDSLEISTHGSIAIIKKMHQLLASFPEVRLAQAGEFAKRSFLNGKMDLTAAEGLADLIEAETELQHKQAIGQLGGKLGKLYEEWRQKLLQLIALLEAYIDFPDEEIPDSILAQINSGVKTIGQSIKEHLADNQRGERLRNGLKLAVIGQPNVGKSSLVNFLMQRELALTSSIAGTTRDIIEGHLDINGYPIIIQDTAGIRQEASDIIEIYGIEKAKKISAEADIKLILFNAEEFRENNIVTIDNYFSKLIDSNSLILVNKIDQYLPILPKKFNGANILAISLTEQKNTKEILTEITKIAEKIARPSENAQITRARHRSELTKALIALDNFSFDNDLILATEDIRLTIRALSNITGIISVDEILGEIFSNFCIGK